MEIGNNRLNDSNFQEEGEYLINKKPKFKYEIKIIHDSSQEKHIKKARTPDKIVPSSKFCIINKPKNKNITKQKLNIIDNNNNISYNINLNDNFYNHYDNYSNYNFYCSKSTKNKKISKKYSIPQTTSQINIFPKTSYNFYKQKKCKKNNYKYIINYEDFEDNKKCSYKKELNHIIQKYFYKKRIENKNYNKKTAKIKSFVNNNENKKITHQNAIIKRRFKTPLKIEKSIENIYNSNKENKIFNNNKTIDNNYKYKEYSKYEKNIKYSNKKVYNKYIFGKNINRNFNSNNYLYIKTKKIIIPEKIQEINNKKDIINHSFVSINDSRNKRVYNNSNVIKSLKMNNINNNYNSSLLKKIGNKELMIHKSSERRDNIKSIPVGQKINPLVVRKTVQKPTIEKIKRDDGSIMNVMIQNSKLTSIETKPIYELKKNNSNNNIVKECITNIYTTLIKNIDEKEKNGKYLIKTKSFDNFNNKKKDKKLVFVKRKIIDKNMTQSNLKKNERIYTNENNNINKDIKKNFSIDISGISNEILINKNINDYFNNNSLISYEQIEPNNAIIINDEVKFIKYLYIQCINSKSKNKAKMQSLSNYFFNLSDEEKIAILTNLNDGNPENKKIYKKLIDILNEKRLEEENSINKSENIFGDISISDGEENRKNNQTDILFKKKKIFK